ncbi:hypothetical protein DOTSEDRAFT_38996 [Dothistroma septosporum NZE10]|uniref:Myb-like domain-containing protein n=1 Tax=Dothistroma septosporum (strain NZE10 / CBS 128990) TaxID=675120 RepID=M2YIK4_DOTSN|nr:hypothetical protein DOTSEDRAFT_38996 [Dothistroma septosporum NZE10]
MMLKTCQWPRYSRLDLLAFTARVASHIGQWSRLSTAANGCSEGSFNRSNWTAEEERMTMEARRQRKTCVEIASMLNRSPAAVRARVSSMLARQPSAAVDPHPSRPKHSRRFTEEDVSHIIAERRKGTPFSDIATALNGAPISSVSAAYYRRLGKQGGDPGYRVQRESFLRAEEVSRILEMRKEGLDWSSIAMKLGRHPSTLSSLVSHGLQDERRSHDVNTKMPWSSRDEEAVRHARDILGLSWRKVAKRLDRSQKAVCTFYHDRKQRASTNRPRTAEPYQPEEDQQLLDLRSKLRTPWKNIHVEMSHRSINSLRHRYRVYIRPDAPLRHLVKVQ